MTYAILLGVGVSMLTSIIVGGRLAWLAFRTRKLPELLMAVALLCNGFLAFAVGTVAKVLIVGHPEWRSSLTITGLSIEYVGCAGMVLFAWRVFHAEKRAAAAAVGLLGVLAIAAFLAELLTGQYLRYSDPEPISGPWIPLALLARGLAPTWLAVECLRLHAQLRRRARLGLADPIVVQRVGLWGVAMTTSALAYVVSFAHRVAYGTGLRMHLWAISIVAGLATLAAVSLWLAFFPPQVYRRRVGR